MPDEINKVIRDLMLPAITANIVDTDRKFRGLTGLRQLTDEDYVAAIRRRQREEFKRWMMSPRELVRESGLAHDELDDNTDELFQLLDRYGWKVTR